MKSTDAYARLRALDLPAISTADAAAVWGLDSDRANKLLTRLAEVSLVTQVRRGFWAMGAKPDPLRLVDVLTAPWPSYVSLQTALHHHGLIEQIPVVTFAVSQGRSRRIQTRVGTISIHHLAPEVFGGFGVLESGIRMATAEKALFDVFYLSATRDRQFASLPELELPRWFDWKTLDTWATKITSPLLASTVRLRVHAQRPRRRARRA